MAKTGRRQLTLAQQKARDIQVQNRKGQVGSIGTVDQEGVFVLDEPRQDIFEPAREAPKRAER